MFEKKHICYKIGYLTQKYFDLFSKFKLNSFQIRYKGLLIIKKLEVCTCTYTHTNTHTLAIVSDKDIDNDSDDDDDDDDMSMQLRESGC